MRTNGGVFAVNEGELEQSFEAGASEGLPELQGGLLGGVTYSTTATSIHNVLYLLTRNTTTSLCYIIRMCNGAMEA